MIAINIQEKIIRIGKLFFTNIAYFFLALITSEAIFIKINMLCGELLITELTFI